jgi:hypothetical protein
MGDKIQLGLYSPMLPNCSCIYKIDDFKRASSGNINIPGSNFYRFPTIKDEEDKDIPSWYPANLYENSPYYINGIYSRKESNYLEFESTIPLGIQYNFMLDITNKDDTSISFYVNDNILKIDYQFIDRVHSSGIVYFNDKKIINHIYNNQQNMTISFSHYSESEDSFKEFLSYGYRDNSDNPRVWSELISPKDPPFVYGISINNMGENFLLKSIKAQRNTLECVNLNNENTRVFPNNLLHPTGYLSIPLRGACTNHIDTLFYTQFPSVGLGEFLSPLFPYNKTKQKHGINNNYCEACYENEITLSNIRLNKKKKIEELDNLILDLDVEWISLQEELSLTEDENEINNIKDRIKNNEENSTNLKEEKENVNNLTEITKEQDILVPHDRGCLLGNNNPCFSENPKIIVDITSESIECTLFKLTGWVGRVFPFPYAVDVFENIEEITVKDEGIFDGTYELYYNSFQEIFASEEQEVEWSFNCSNGKTIVKTKYIVYIPLEITYLDFETGQKRHSIGVFEDDLDTGGREFSLKDCCGREVLSKTNSHGYLKNPPQGVRITSEEAEWCTTGVSNEPKYATYAILYEDNKYGLFIDASEHEICGGIKGKIKETIYEEDEPNKIVPGAIGLKYIDFYDNPEYSEYTRSIKLG